MHRSRVLIGTLLLLVVVASLAAPLAPATTRDDIRGSLERAEEARDAAARAEIAADRYRAEARSLDDTIRNLANEVATLEARITEATAVSTRLQAELDALRRRIAEKEAEIERTTAKLEHQQALLAERMTTSYKQGSWFFLDLLFQAETISDFIARTALAQRVMAANQGIAAQLADTNERLEAQHAELDRTRESVSTKRAEAAAVENRLRSIRSERSSVLARQQQAQDEMTALMEASEADAERLRAMAEEEEETARRLEAELRAQASAGAGHYQGVMAWPLPGGTVSSPYGWRTHPIFRTRRFHHGIDIRGGSGIIVAAADGVVIRALYGWNGGYGNMIVIDHGDGVTTVYTHIRPNGIKVSNGERVSKGQEIALVGSTGYSTGPHLHFEVRINGRSTDPMPYLR